MRTTKIFGLGIAAAVLLGGGRPWAFPSASAADAEKKDDEAGAPPPRNGSGGDAPPSGEKGPKGGGKEHDHEKDHPDGDHPKAPGPDGTGHKDEPENGKKEDGHADEVRLTAEAIKKFGIRTETARRHALVATFPAPARVTLDAERVAHAGSPLSGRVAEIRARVGDAVKKGDVLMVIDSPELGESQSDYLQKLAGLESAAPAEELAKNGYDRARALYDETKGIAFTEVQKREGEYKAARGALIAARAAATAAENRLHLVGMDQTAVETLKKSGEIDPRYVLRSPLDGKVIEREATIGEHVGPDREALFVLADLSRYWVLADVPEARLHEVVKGCRAAIRATGTRGRVLEGVVSYIPPLIDSSTRSASVRVEVPGEGSGLVPGMFAQVEIATASEDGAKEDPVLAVPEEAVQTVEGSPCVFVPVQGEENTFAARRLRTGPAIGGMVPVLEGLKEGDAFVVSGSFILKADLGKGEGGHDH